MPESGPQEGIWKSIAWVSIGVNITAATAWFTLGREVATVSYVDKKIEAIQKLQDEKIASFSTSIESKLNKLNHDFRDLRTVVVDAIRVNSK